MKTRRVKCAYIMSLALIPLQCLYMVYLGIILLWLPFIISQ